MSNRNKFAQVLICWHQQGGRTLWAERNGYFPNGQPAAQWVTSERRASVFTRSEALSIRKRVELREGERVVLVGVHMRWQPDGKAKVWRDE